MRRDKIEKEENRDRNKKNEGMDDQRRRCHDRLKDTTCKKALREGRFKKQWKPRQLVMTNISMLNRLGMDIKSQITTGKSVEVCHAA